MTQVTDGAQPGQTGTALERMQQPVDPVKHTKVLRRQLPASKRGIDAVEQIAAIIKEQAQEFLIGVIVRRACRFATRAGGLLTYGLTDRLNNRLTDRRGLRTLGRLTRRG